MNQDFEQYEEEWFDDQEGLEFAIAQSLNHQYPTPTEPQDDIHYDEEDELLEQIKRQSLNDYVELETRELEEKEFQRIADERLREEQDMAYMEAMENDRKKFQTKHDEELEKYHKQEDEEYWYHWKKSTEAHLNDVLLPNISDSVILRIRVGNKIHQPKLNINETMINVIDGIRILMYDENNENYQRTDLKLIRMIGGPVTFSDQTRIKDLGLEFNQGRSELLVVD